MKWNKVSITAIKLSFLFIFSSIGNVFHRFHDEKKQIGDFIDHIRNGPKRVVPSIRLDERRAAIELSFSLQGLLCDVQVSRLARLPSI